MVEKIDKVKFDELIKGEKPVVCDFFATWCGPCKMLAPVMEECSEKYEGKAAFVKVDIDENFELAARFGISSIPMVGVFKGGLMVQKSIGYTSKEETEQILDAVL